VIKAAAIVCRYCQRDIPPQQDVPEAQQCEEGVEPVEDFKVNSTVA
jgi:hypothetical protein